MNLRFAPWGHLRAALSQKAEPENVRLIAEELWLAYLACGLLAALCAIAWGFVAWRGVAAALDQGSHPSALSGASVDKASLDALAAEFSNRQQEYDSLKANPPAIPNP